MFTIEQFSFSIIASSAKKDYGYREINIVKLFMNRIIIAILIEEQIFSRIET
jgi:hypothetical protein